MKKKFATLFLVWVMVLPLSGASAAEKAPEGDPVVRAVFLTERGDFGDAENILKELVSKIPSNWKPISESSEEITGSFWDEDEFRGYIAYFKGTLKKSVKWGGPSYSKAYFQLAYIANEREDLQSALDLLEKGIELEPDQPALLGEKVFVLTKMKRYQEAYSLALKASESRPWNSNLQKGDALRQAGIALIDMNKLEEAKAILARSLEFDPNNIKTFNELAYINQLRKKESSQARR